MNFNRHITSPRLAISLAAALLQGLLLVWLHTRLQDETWPANDPAWLAALYAVGVFLPISSHLLSEHWRSLSLWVSLALMGALLFYFGWHFGGHVAAALPERPIEGDSAPVFGISVALLWLLFMPFLRRRLVTGRWRGEYAQLFTLAWQNKIALAEAGAFTGATWLLVMLWAMLFKTLGYDLFDDFFKWPGFVYPFTAVTFGVALHLIGSVERIVTVVREQLLGLLKWLTPVAALILALFTPTLLVKLPGLVSSGKQVIGAAFLLWIVTVTVLLLNAGYQNGQGERPYPRPLALALRIVVPAMLVVAATALYSLSVRVGEYGMTVERVFAFIIGLAALAYSVGYAVAALRSGPWMQGMERVNVLVAIGLIVIIAATLTPIGSPYRLAASSQKARAIASAAVEATRDSALTYLRFDSGRYGLLALRELEVSRSKPAFAKLGTRASEFLAIEDRWRMQRHIDANEIADIEVFPAGRKIDAELARALRFALADSGVETGNAAQSKPCILLVDLNDDEMDEAVLFARYGTDIFARRGSRWIRAGSTGSSDCDCKRPLREALAAGDYRTQPVRWHDLRIGSHVLRAAKAINEPP